MKLRHAAPIFGITISRLSRIERGKEVIPRETEARIEGATDGAVKPRDHAARWRAEESDKFERFYAAGRAAMKAYLRPAKPKKGGR